MLVFDSGSCQDMLVSVFETIHLDTMPRCLGGLYQARVTTYDLRGTNKLTVPCVKTATPGYLGAHLQHCGIGSLRT